MSSIIRRGRQLEVRKTDLGYFAVSEDEDETLSIPLTEEDVKAYRVSVPQFADYLRSVLGIRGVSYDVVEEILHLGSKKFDDLQTCEVLLSFPNRNANELCRRIQKWTDFSRGKPMIVLTLAPLSLKAEDIERFEKMNAFVCSVEYDFDVKNPMVDWSTVVDQLPLRDSKSDNIFKKDGNVWRLRFGGQQISVEHRVGMNYIWYLLKHPKEECALITLNEFGMPPRDKKQASEILDTGDAEDGESFSSHTPEQARDAILDDQALQEYKTKLQEIEEELAETQSEKRREELLHEKDALLDQVKQGTALGGRQRTMTDYTDSLRKKISNAIDRSIENIQKAGHPTLATHLSAFIEKGNPMVYRPDQTLIWET